MPKISVIVPVYRSEKYLSACLDSVLTQTFTDFELICINDGSPDKCLSILARYQERDSRVVVLDQENMGQSEARNVGIQNARGEYLFFVDSDDCLLHPRALEVILRVAEETDAPITVSNYFVRSSKKQRVPEEKFEPPVAYKIHTETVRDLLKDRYLSSLVWNKLFKREVFEGYSFIPGISFEDWPLITCMFSDVPFYVSIDIPLYLYNDLDASTVRSPFTVKKIEDYVTGVYFVYKYYRQPEKRKYWRLVQRKRIKQSLKMVLSKVYHARKEQPELVYTYLKEIDKLREKKIFHVWDFSLKAKCRLLMLYLYRHFNRCAS